MRHEIAAELGGLLPGNPEKQLECDLRSAIHNDHLRLVYQPIMDRTGETMIGVEALCRWNHPICGDIAPTEFISLAENNGLIIPLGEWALRKACSDAIEWPGLLTAVNVSPLQFHQSNFVANVQRILSETGLDPKSLELELTESVLVDDFERAQATMRELKSLGVRLALDDFGTGYSSLNYLVTLPFDKLKIDRSFVLRLETGANGAAIVHAIVSLGRGLGMHVTAEGVDNETQQVFLRVAGVHSFQGFLFGRPVEAQDIAARLATQSAAAARAR